MDPKKIALVKPARGSYDVAASAVATYAYLPEWLQCVAGVLGGAMAAGGPAGLALRVAVVASGLTMGPALWLMLAATAAGGALLGAANFC